MIVKIIQFSDCRAIATDEKIQISGMKCIYVKNINLLPKEPLLEFTCREELFSDICHNIELFKKTIDLYMVKEITMDQLKIKLTQINTKL